MADPASLRMLRNTSSLISKRVCIIGAGMTGICVCKHLLQHGIEPIVLEAQDSIGGVWRHTFSITKLQTRRNAYQFSDFEWPDGTPEFPSHVQVKDYLESYAKKFHALERIRFNCKVVEIRPSKQEEDKQAKWDVRIQNQATKDATNEEWLHFDFLVLCIGRHGDIPKFPSLPPSRGPEIFQGKVLHSMEYASLNDKVAEELLSNRRVIVVGLMKSALDVSVEAANANQGIHGHACTMIFRTANWMIPDHKPFGLPLTYIYSTRLSELMIPKPDQGLLLSVLSTLLTPVKWAISKSVELYLLLNLPLYKFGLIPKQTFLKQFSSCEVPTLPESFFRRVQEGQIILRKTTEWSFSKNGVILDDGTNIEADVVILGTGYDGEKKLRSILPKSYLPFLQEPGSITPLYRGIIHPRMPHLAFVGYHNSFSNLHSSEMGARWLAHLLSGKFMLPGIDQMENVAQRWIQYMKRSTPTSCFGAVNIWYSDQLCRDMGWNPRRKKNIIQEFLVPYSNMDYKDPVF